MTKEYLGDSVYAEFSPERDTVILTTENGYGPSNTIYIEPWVAWELIVFLQKCGMVENA